MEQYLIGTGTFINTLTVLFGGGVGMLVGSSIPERTRSVVVDCLGIVTLLMGALSAMSVTDENLSAALGTAPPVLVVMAALLIGGVVGSLLRIEERLDGLGDAVISAVQRRRDRRSGGSSESDNDTRRRYLDGWLTTTLLFCVGPMTILGSLQDGMGRGFDQLAVKSVLDGFASVAFASTYGAGVLASAGSVLVVQGSLTLVGAGLGTVMPAPHIAALTATGGLMLVALALRLLRIRDIPVGDLLPALLVAPLVVELVVRLT